MRERLEAWPQALSVLPSFETAAPKRAADKFVLAETGHSEIRNHPLVVDRLGGSHFVPYGLTSVNGWMRGIAQAESNDSFRVSDSKQQGYAKMMLLKITRVGEGLHPSETLVSIETREGPAEIAVDSLALRKETLPIGWPVGKNDGFLLVELPRPTVSGARRVWVRKEELIPDKTARRTA